MNRGIPPVRKWRVRYWRDKIWLGEIVVETINREFAEWMGWQKLGRTLATLDPPSPRPNRATVSLVRDQRHAS